MEKFTIGLLAGMVGGALLATNNYKMRTLVRKGQEELKCKLDEMLDEKMKEFDVQRRCCDDGVAPTQKAQGSETVDGEPATKEKAVRKAKAKQ